MEMDMVEYAWIIDKDHLAAEERKVTGTVEDDATGKTGPGAAPDWLVAHLATCRDAGNRTLNGRQCVTFRFKMFDGDGELYYSGRMITAEVDGPSEEACYAPLSNFGAPNAGAVAVIYPGHKDMDCG